MVVLCQPGKRLGVAEQLLRLWRAEDELADAALEALSSVECEQALQVAEQADRPGDSERSAQT
jgi:hypothetical protein